MLLSSVVKKAWKGTKTNFVEKRYLQNYPNDLIAGNISRTPIYAIIDNAVFGVADEKVLGSMLGALTATACGWAFAYTSGHSLMSTALKDFYKRHSKKVDFAYSGMLTFGFGMAVNSAAGYDLKEALAASTVRAAIGVPLGPWTRWHTDSFRHMRGEPSASGQPTQFSNKWWKINTILALNKKLKGSISGLIRVYLAV